MKQSSTHLDALRDLTVILPTIGSERLPFATAAAQQWSATPAQIIVADGSAESRPQPFRDRDNVTYLSSSDPFESRLANAAKTVESQFTLMICDDDVFVPSAIAACVVALKALPNYSAIFPHFVMEQGQYYGLRTRQIDYDNNGTTPTSRLAFWGREPLSRTVYGVCRSESFKSSYISAARDPIRNLGYLELHHEIFMNSVGKVCVSPQVGLIRRRVVPSVSSEGVEPAVNPASTQPSSQGNSDRTRFIDRVSSGLAESLSLPYLSIRHEVASAYESYERQYVEKRRVPTTRREIFKGAIHVHQRLPHSIRGLYSPLTRPFKERFQARVPGWERLEILCRDRDVVLPGDALTVLQDRVRLEQRFTQHET